MSYLNVSAHLRPKYLAGFRVLLAKCVPENQIDNTLLLLEKHELIHLNKREVVYSPLLVGN